MVQNTLICPKMVQNGPYKSKSMQDGTKWSNMFQNCLKLVKIGSNWSKIIQHIQNGKYGPILSKAFKLSLKRLNGPKCFFFKSKLAQYGQHSFKIILQNDCSWCDSSWG